MGVLANSGLPMIFVQLPYLVLALLPAALVEALVFRALVSLPLARALPGSLVANLCSTCVGVPATWLLLLFADLAVGGGGTWELDTPLLRLAAVTVQAPWLVPREGQMYWMIPAASLFLMLPFFLASVVTERFVLERWWPDAAGSRLRRAIWLGNLLSYGALADYWIVRLLLAEPRHLG